jgi:diguanylate cyclase (GGDEF)-like protein
MLKAERSGMVDVPSPAAGEGKPTLFRAAIVYVTLVAGCLIVWLALKPGSRAVFVDVDDVLRLLGPVGVVLLGLWRTGSWSRRAAEPISGRLPLILALSVVCFALGRALVTGYDIFLGHPAPSPSVADAAWLASYPILLTGVFLLPITRMNVSAMARLVLDVLLLLIAVGAYSWYFILGPDIVSEHAAVPARVVSAAYLMADLALIGCMVVLWSVFWQASASAAARTRQVVVILGLGLIVLVTADSISQYQILHGLLSDGMPLDLGRPLGYMLVALAAIAARTARVGNPEKGAEPAPPGRGSQGSRLTAQNPRPSTPRVWRYLLPYASVPVVVALMIYAARTDGYAAPAVGVYVAFAILIELVFLHQFLDYRELIAFSNRNARLESLAAADPVTGLPNHRTIVSALDVEVERARRYHRPCTVLFLDLDHFKALNDSYGHPSGDSALREFASVVRTALRGIDILGRWGGEEFVAMLPETDVESALVVAERVRAAVAAHTFWSTGGAHLTCSIGIASYPEDAENRDELIEMADRAMYAAKRLGRNQVRPASDPAVAVLEANPRTASVHEEAALLGTVEALVALVEAHDHSTCKHSAEVAALASRLALALGLDTSDAHAVGLAARLHDIGKVGIPDSILYKPARLSPDEWALMARHPAAAAAVVSRVPALRFLAPAIRAHHEFWNGQGYPDGLRGDAIPLYARILAVANAYQAMTAGRPYNPSRTPEKALAEIRRCSGSQFDPDVVDALCRVLKAEVTPDHAVGVA